MTQVLESTSSVLSKQEIEAFRHDGFHVARGLFTSAEMESVRETFMCQAKDGPVPGLSETRHHSGGEYDASDPLHFYPRMMHPHKHSDKPVGPLSMKYLLDRRVEAVLRALLDEEPVAAQTMFYFKPPGARGQALHQDNFYLRVKPGTCMAAWTAIDDADEGNGGMMCVPGTGEMDIVCPEKADPSKFFTAEYVHPPANKQPRNIRLKSGDVLFFNGSVIHGSSPNTSKDRFRRSFICHYVPMSCVEVSGGYRPLLTFDGRDISKQEAIGGGPCGTLIASTSPH